MNRLSPATRRALTEIGTGVISALAFLLVLYVGLKVGPLW